MMNCATSRTPIVTDEETAAKLNAAWKVYSDEIESKFKQSEIHYSRDEIHQALRDALIEQANTFRSGEGIPKELRDIRYDRANTNVKHILQGVFQALMAHGKPEEVVRGYLGDIVGKTMRTIMEAFPDVERRELLAPRDSILPGMMPGSRYERY